MSGEVKSIVQNIDDRYEGRHMKDQVSREQVTDALGMKVEALRAVEEGDENLNWTEYLALLLLLGQNEESRRRLEERGLFPAQLRVVPGTEKGGAYG